jgi:hypothetical protein
VFIYSKYIKRNRMKLNASMALLIASCAAGAAHAEDGFPPVTVSGFGTLALTRSNTDDAQFARSNQEKGATTSAKSGVDSSFGVQASSKFNQWLSVTAQGLVRKDAIDSYGAELSLAFAQLNVNDELSIRAGRIAAPIYYISEYRNVGYASTMIRPPVEMYVQVPVNNLDGIDAIYRTSYGDTNITGQASFGKSDFLGVSGSQLKLKRFTNLAITAENGPFTLRLQRASANVTLDNSPDLALVAGGLAALGFPAQSKQVTIKDSKATFSSLGLGVDWNNYVAQAEYGRRTSVSAAISDSTSWYTLFGYRIGKFLPFVSHASTKQDSPRTLAGLPSGGPAQLQALVGAANSIAKGPIQTSSSIGVRWDFHKSAAFKAQLDRYSPKDGTGTFINAKPGFKGPVTVLAAGVDFVF